MIASLTPETNQNFLQQSEDFEQERAELEEFLSSAVRPGSKMAQL